MAQPIPDAETIKAFNKAVADEFRANDGKVVDSNMARELALWARWGHPCGRPFDGRSHFASSDGNAARV